MDFNDKANALARRVLEAGRLHELLLQLGCRLERPDDGRGVYRSPCPIHGDEDSDPNNFEVKPGRDIPVVWQCFSRCRHNRDHKNGLLGLVRGVLARRAGKPDRPLSAPLFKAARLIEDFLKSPAAAPRPGLKRAARARPKVEPPEPIPRAEVREALGLQVPSPYFLARGYTAEALEALDVGHSSTLGRTVVPVFDDRGGLCVGHLSRAESDDGSPRWKVQAGFLKSDWLYNLRCMFPRNERGLVCPRRERGLLLVEGPADVLRCEEAGVPAVALMGSDLSEEQRVTLMCLPWAVYVALDNDEAGQAGAARIAADGGFPLEVCPPPGPYRDVGEMPAGELREWAEGLGVLAPRRR